MLAAYLYFSIGNGQTSEPTSTVPAVSAHFRSLRENAAAVICSRGSTGGHIHCLMERSGAATHMLSTSRNVGVAASAVIRRAYYTCCRTTLRAYTLARKSTSWPRPDAISAVLSPELSMGWVDPWVGLGPLQQKYQKI